MYFKEKPLQKKEAGDVLKRWMSSIATKNTHKCGIYKNAKKGFILSVLRLFFSLVTKKHKLKNNLINKSVYTNVLLT